jgi:hypothetical protein
MLLKVLTGGKLVWVFAWASADAAGASLVAQVTLTSVFQNVGTGLNFVTSILTLTVAVIALWRVSHVAKLVNSMNTKLRADKTDLQTQLTASQREAAFVAGQIDATKQPIVADEPKL